MRASNADTSASLLHKSNRLCVTHHVNAATSGFIDFWMLTLDGSARNDEIAGCRQLVCGMTDAYGDTFSLKSRGCWTC
jgi:hypothetical protein